MSISGNMDLKKKLTYTNSETLPNFNKGGNPDIAII